MSNLKEYCTFYKEKPIYEIFNDNTSLSRYNVGVFLHYIALAMESGYVNSIKDYKNFSNYDKIDISNYGNGFINDICFLDVLLNRRSCRNFNEEFVTLDELAAILRYSCCASFKMDKLYLFNYPISGGIDSLYFIVIVSKVQEIEKGIYLYNTIDNELILLSKGFEYEEYENITSSTSLTVNSCFSVYILANTEIKCFKYQDRGYRFLNLEAGHVAQNLCLVAEGVSVGSVVSGGFLDMDFLNYLEYRNISNSFFDEGILLYEIFFGKYDF